MRNCEGITHVDELEGNHPKLKDGLHPFSRKMIAHEGGIEPQNSQSMPQIGMAYLPEKGLS